MEQSHDLLSNDIEINEVTQSTLSDAARWGKFLAIIGFIFCVLMVVAAFFLSNFIASRQGYNYNSSVTSATSTAVTVVYIIFAVLLFFPCLFLYKFSVKMQQAFKTASQEYFDVSVQYLKSMFKYVGILTIIILGLWIISLLIVAVSAAG